MVPCVLLGSASSVVLLRWEFFTVEIHEALYTFSYVDVRVYTCVSPLVFDEHDCLQRPHSNTPLSHSYSLGE